MCECVRIGEATAELNWSGLTWLKLRGRFHVNDADLVTRFSPHQTAKRDTNSDSKRMAAYTERVELAAYDITYLTTEDCRGQTSYSDTQYSTGKSQYLRRTSHGGVPN